MKERGGDTQDRELEAGPDGFVEVNLRIKFPSQITVTRFLDGMARELSLVGIGGQEISKRVKAHQVITDEVGNETLEVIPQIGPRQ